MQVKYFVSGYQNKNEIYLKNIIGHFTKNEINTVNEIQYENKTKQLGESKIIGINCRPILDA